MTRLFDETEEVFLWRVGEGKWRGRRIVEGIGQTSSYFDEPQILWGTQVEAASADFGRVADGEQGMRHAPPVELQVQDWQEVRRLRLGLRDYLGEDEAGWLRVTMSRMTSVWKEALR